MSQLASSLSLVFSAAVLAAILACGGNGAAPPSPTAAAPSVPGLGTPAQPRSCDMRATDGQCSEYRAAFFADTDDATARDTCIGTYATTPCATDGVLGHCVTPRIDFHYYVGGHIATAADAQAACAVEHGVWGATAP